MAIFGNLFGGKKPPPTRHTRKEQEAAIHVAGQSQRRQKLLAERVKTGASSEVYKNRKPVNVLSTGIAGALESPYEQDFMDGFLFSRFSSSNVWALQYDRTKSELYVQYMGGSGKKKSGPGKWYRYGNVAPSEAKVAYVTASKGVFSWQYLRRGKKPYSLGTPPSYLPLGRSRQNVLRTP